MPARGEIRISGRQGTDAVKVIGQNHDGFEGEGPTPAGRLEDLPKVANVFSQEFPAALQQGEREKEGAAGDKGSKVLGHK